jgi:actin related protein 2/3 complex subunit 1A/1B
MRAVPGVGYTRSASRRLAMSLPSQVSPRPSYSLPSLSVNRAFTGHDSSISIVYPSGPIIYTIRTASLPFVTLTWTAENALVAAGHDCQPILFSGDESSGWAAVGSLDDTTAPKSALGGSKAGYGAASPVGRLNSAAFNTFRNADSRGLGSVPGSPISPSGGGWGGETEMMTVHQNTITSLRPYEGRGGAVTKVSSSGVDGKLVIWDVSNVSGGGGGGLASKMGGMHLR